MAKRNKGLNAEKISDLFGFDLDEVKTKVDEYVPPQNIDLEIDAISSYVYKPGLWYDRVCKICGRAFVASYRYVSLCSTTCRKKEMEHLGLRWDPTRTVEQKYTDLGIEPPGIIPPDALQALIRIGKRYAEHVDPQ